MKRVHGLFQQIRASRQYSRQILSEWYYRDTCASFRHLWSQYCRKTDTRFSIRGSWQLSILSFDQENTGQYRSHFIWKAVISFKKGIWYNIAELARCRQLQSGWFQQGTKPVLAWQMEYAKHDQCLFFSPEQVASSKQQEVKGDHGYLITPYILSIYSLVKRQVISTDKI